MLSWPGFMLDVTRAAATGPKELRQPRARATETGRALAFRASESRIDCVTTLRLGREEGVRLYGRDRELDVLSSLVDHAGEGGGAVVVRGEAGIGKSSLVAEKLQACGSPQDADAGHLRCAV